MSSTDAIRVFCRVRPSKRPSGFFIPDTLDNAVHFSVPVDIERDVTNNAGSINTYKFSGVFDGSSTQEDVFDVVAREAVDAAVAGFNSTVFAYGQTGEKSYVLSLHSKQFYNERKSRRCVL